MILPASKQSIASLALVVICLLIALNLAIYAGLFSHPTIPDQHQLFLPGLPDQTTAILQTPLPPSPNLLIQRLLPVISLSALILVIGSGAIGFLLVKRGQKRHRDQQRLNDLNTIATTLEQYFNRHGHYPVSATYDAQYYSAINILTEWSSYNFPPAEEMRQFNPQWPPSDPNFNPIGKNQAGNYLYYPHHFGQQFSLYAELEAPIQNPIPDYNTIDKLPVTFGKYNFRLNGPNHHQGTTHPPSANQPPNSLSLSAPQS